MKKITVQGSSVKQRLMITGLVSWVIISTFYIGWKVCTGKCSQGLFLRKRVDLEWVSYTPLHLKSNPLLIQLLQRSGVYQTQSTLCLGVECGVEFLGVNPSLCAAVGKNEEDEVNCRRIRNHRRGRRHRHFRCRRQNKR